MHPDLWHESQVRGLAFLEHIPVIPTSLQNEGFDDMDDVATI